MSSLVIGLDINDSYITSALVRVEQLENQNRFTIERDTYFTRSFEYNGQIDPREIISIWIQCINDLLLDFVNNYQNNETIIGIAIGIPGPMDYQSGISYNQSPTFQKFFGLNLRLSIEYALKDLISRWKTDYYTPPKKRNLINKSSGKPLRRMTITPPATPSNPIILNIPTTTIERYEEKTFFENKFIEFL